MEDEFEDKLVRCLVETLDHVECLVDNVSLLRSKIDALVATLEDKIEI